MNLTHPYDRPDLPFLKGNLHTHTTNSDGQLDPPDTAQRYADAGYDYLCLSDHDFFTPVWDHEHLILVPGVEVTANGPHLLAIGPGKVYDTSRPRGGIIAEIVADGGLCVLAHPNWLHEYRHWPQEALQAVGPYHGIEIFNSVIDRLEGEGLAYDRWDRLLSAGQRVWGYAHDDMHHQVDCPRAYNAVQAEQPTAASIVDALKRGRFYSGNGVTITSITVAGDTLTVETEDAQEIRFIGEFGKVLGVVYDQVGHHTISPHHKYVRAQCYGRGSQMAWTQPVFVEP